MKRKCYPNFTENRGTLWTRLLSSPARSRTKPGCNWVIWCWLVLQHGAHQPLSSPLQMAGIGHSVSGSGLWENPITHSHRTHGIKILSNYFSRIIRIKKQKTKKKERRKKNTSVPHKPTVTTSSSQLRWCAPCSSVLTSLLTSEWHPSLSLTTGFWLSFRCSAGSSTGLPHFS